MTKPIYFIQLYLFELCNLLLLTRVEQLEEGYSEVSYLGYKYTVSKSVFNKGKSVKIFAKNSANADFISFNLYKTKAGTQLKPCEMKKEKVISFLVAYECT